MTAVEPRLEREHALALLRQMLRIRRFEERCAELYSLGKVRGFLHLYIGEEAIAAGAMQALGPDDAIVGTYREHGHALARGVPAGALMAELFGKANGCSGGRGGSMHFFDAERRLYGGFAIVAGGPAGGRRPRAGRRDAAAAARHRVLLRGGRGRRGRVPRVAQPRGALEAARRVPVREQPLRDGHRAGALGVRDRHPPQGAQLPHPVEGRRRHGRARGGVGGAGRGRAARKGGGPQFLELRTYRFRAHSMYDAELYRTKDEVGEWMHRDPIALFEARMRADGLLADADLEAIEADIATELDQAVAEAEAGPWEPVEDLTRNVYADGART